MTTESDLQAKCDRLTLLVEVFRLYANDPSFIDWTTEELQEYHDELSADDYVKKMPPEWKKDK